MSFAFKSQDSRRTFQLVWLTCKTGCLIMTFEVYEGKPSRQRSGGLETILYAFLCEDGTFPKAFLSEFLRAVLMGSW